MDDRRFDTLTKALASGTSRRTLFKGLLGLGGVAAIGGALRDDGVDAARRPTPTPTPVRCPGQQVPVGGVCTCPPAVPEKCGSDCCNPAGIGPVHSECCDNACCFGVCYGEELCCDFPLVFCEAVNECCGPEDNQCCGAEGCCDTACCPVADGSAACCEGDTPRCCGGDACIPADGCCTDDECPGCQSCENHICVDNQAECPGCTDCVNAECVTNNANCDDGSACTSNVCNRDGSCTYNFNCNLAAGCCDDGSPCTNNVCGTDGQCSYPFYCTSDACCTGGQLCDESTGACFTPCAGEQQSCVDVACCAGVCFGIPDVTPEICFSCIPSTFEGIPVPCLGFCQYCCNYDYLGFCVDCNPPLNSCQADPNSCCDGLCCQYNPISDNFCSIACI
jgi:hypothetical protein